MKLSPYSVAVVVSDRKKAKKWYSQKLGLKVLAESDHWVVVGRKSGLKLHLCQTTEYDAKGKLEPGNSGILFFVDGDVRKAHAALKKKGVKFSHAPTKEAWGWYCSFLDPDGNEFWLMPQA